MKRHFTFLLIACYVFCLQSHAQWQANTVGTQSGNYGVNGIVKITSSAGSVGGDNNYQGLIVNNGNFDAPTFINQAFDNIPTANLFKAKAGVPFTINMEILHQYFPDRYLGENWATTHQVFLDYFPGDCWGCQPGDWYNGTIRSLTGKNETPWLYDEDLPMIKNSQYEAADPFGFYFGLTRKSTFSRTYTFPVGRTRAWIVIGFREKSYTIYNQNSYNNLIILPFVVEGPTVAQIPVLGVTKQPQIPYLVIHNPPGDKSTTTISNIGTTCRSFEEKVSKDESDQTYGDFKVGFKGSIGFLYELELEAYVQLSVERTEGVIESRQNDDESCITISRSLTTQSSGRGAQNNDLFIGYGIDLEYGWSRRVNIINNQARIDTGIVYSPIDSTKTDFFLTKIGIEDDIVRQQAIVNDSLNKTIAQRAAAQYQINVWRQVLDKNAATIASAASQAGSFEDFSGESPVITKERSYSFSRSHSIEVEHYIENQDGLEGAVFFAGSGFKAGAKFKTTKSFGQVQTTTGQNIESVKVQLEDNDVADRFRYKIVNDPVYGTPIFLLDSINSFTSCPYEGGIKLDQPLLKINGSTSRSVSVSNVSLGTAGRFNVEVCNNTPVVRNYGLGYVNESAKNNLIIKSNSQAGTVNPINGVTQFATIFNIPANGGCKTGTFEISMERGDAAAPMAYQGIEFVLYSECDTNSSIASRIFANVDFAGPPPPTGVAASASEICTGTPVTLTANCPVTTTPTWYTIVEGGFPFAQGTNVVVNPTVNTTYYVGCETPDYKRDRVATQLVLVGSPSTVLNLTTDYSTNSLQIANTTLTATNKIIDPARVTYKAGNSLTFNPGFEVKAGSNFLAKIGGCAN